MKPLFDATEAPRFTPEGRQALLDALTAAPAAAETPLRPRRGLRGALVAAAAVCLLTVGAAAVAISLPVLREHFGGGAGYEQSSTLIGKSVTTEGWTMTLTDCVGDDRYLILGFELEAPEGTVLERGDYRPRRDKPIFSGGVSARAWDWRQLPDEDSTDNRLRFGLWIEHIQDELGDPSLNGQTMELVIEDLTYPIDTAANTWEEAVLFRGSWDFGSLVISYPDRTLRMDPDLPVTVLDVPARITHVEVSPIGVDVWFEGDALKGHDGRYPWPGQCFQEPEITLYDKDGNPLEPDYYTPFGIRGGSGCNGNPKVAEDDPGPYFLNIIQSYGYLLDMDNLDHIDICGVSIPLTPAEAERES